MALGIFSPSGPRSCKNNKFVQIDHTHQEIVCFAKFFNVMNVVYSFVAANSVRHLIWLQNQINKIPIMLKILLDDRICFTVCRTDFTIVSIDEHGSSLHLLFCKLTVVKFVIESAFGEQLLVCALFNDVAVLHNKDNIAFLDC